MSLQDELLALENLEEHRLLTAEQLSRKIEIQSKLMKMLEQDEIYWNERSNNNWLLKVDGNTKFFHRVANGKK